jgi:hypothetical protein
MSVGIPSSGKDYDLHWRDARFGHEKGHRLATEFSWSSSTFPIKYLDRTQIYAKTASFNPRSIHSFVFILWPEPLTTSLHEGKVKGKDKSPPTGLCGSAV